MFDRVPMLGQVAITEQAGFGGPPWSVSTPLNPNYPFPAPPGAPLYTEENTGRWMCPDGVERVLTVAQAQAMGCTRRNLMYMMGQNGAPAPSPGGAPTVSVTPTVHDGGPGFVQNRVEFFPQWWGWPQYPQYPAQQRLVCKKLEEESEKEGQDVFECVYQPVARPASLYPLYTYPMQALSWWF